MKMTTQLNMSVDNFSKICRVCLLSDDLLPFLYLDINTLFKELTKIEVDEFDQFPKNICRNCLSRLKDIELFIEQCITNNSLLKRALEQTCDNTPLETKINIFPEDDYLIKYGTLLESEVEEENDVENEIYQCAICNGTFLIKKLLIQHMQEHNKNIHSLGTDKTISSNKLTNNKNKFEKKCDICGKTFYTKMTLFKHKKVHNKGIKRGRQSKITAYDCTECNRVLTSQSSLDNHMKTHTGARPYKCTYCGKDFPYLSSLTVHTRLHTGETPYICPICNKGYRSSTSLKKHKENKHLIEQEYEKEDNHKDNISEELDKVECSVCNKVLSKHGYGTHIRIHTSEKKVFYCTFCNKVFQKKSHLDRHVRIHTGERPYTCNICNRSFTQDGDLKRHVIIHSGQKEFQCQHCGKQFCTKGSLSTHILNHKEMKKELKLECNICNKPSSECDKVSHIKNLLRPFLCTICGKSFTSNGSLKVHHRLHTGENPYACNLCNKAYNNSSALKGHVIRKHTGEKPHSCMICHKRYHDSTNLKRHINRAHSVVEIQSGNRNNDTLS